jgi:hypothetical protein
MLVPILSKFEQADGDRTWINTVAIQMKTADVAFSGSVVSHESYVLTLYVFAYPVNVILFMFALLLSSRHVATSQSLTWRITWLSVWRSQFPHTGSLRPAPAPSNHSHFPPRSKTLTLTNMIDSTITWCASKTHFHRSKHAGREISACYGIFHSTTTWVIIFHKIILTFLVFVSPESSKICLAVQTRTNKFIYFLVLGTQEEEYCQMCSVKSNIILIIAFLANIMNIVIQKSM